MPRWLGQILAAVLTWIGPKGLEFAKYSIEYHYIRNYLYVMRHWGARADRHIPSYAKRIVQRYDAKDGAVSKRLALGKPPGWERRKPQIKQ